MAVPHIHKTQHQQTTKICSYSTEKDHSQTLAAAEERLLSEELSARIGVYKENSFLRHRQVSLLYLVNHHHHFNLEIIGIEMMTLIIGNEGVRVPLRPVIDRRPEVLREGNQIFHLLLLEDAAVVEAAVVVGEVTSTVLVGGKHYALLYNLI